MTNDTTTLNGALAELGETMATNITAKGVSASASDGLTTLAGKISQISQSGGGTPVVEFDNTNFGTHFAFTRPSGNYKDTFTIHVPSGTTHLVEYCFYYLKNLTGIDLPTGLTEIGQYAFYYCEGLTEVEIPNTVSTIGQNAFYYCTSLQSVNIPTSLSSIPTNCFRYSGLTSVTIPSNITSMSNYAFGNCTSMQKIRFESATPPTVTSSTFQNLPTTCVIEVPCDSLSLYTSASNYPSSSTYTYVPYGCNGLKFLQDSYTTSTGTCEVSLRLWDNNAPVSGGTITITGSDSSSYTCTTDSNGEATCTLTNVSGTVTYTATYSSYSATCTVTRQTYLFYDDCSSSRVTEYTTKGNQTITYDSNGYYEIKVTSQSCPNVKINSVTVPNRVKISMDMKMVTSGSNSQPKIYLFDESKNKGYGLRITQNNSKWNLQTYTSYTDCGNNLIETTINTSLNTWYHMELIVDGNDLTGNLYNSSNTLLGTITSTGSLNLSSTGNYVAIGCNYTKNAIIQVKNIKVEAL